MKIGNLYLVKKHRWFLFPTKEISVEGTTAAAYYSKNYNCEAAFIKPESIIVFLDEDGEYKQILTSDGRIGWTSFDDYDNDFFEEVKAGQ